MSAAATILRLELAHGLPRAPSSAPGDGLPEAFARARLVHESPDLSALRRWPSATTLGDVRAPWRFEPFPDLLIGLLAELERASGAQLEVRAPTEVQESLRQRAPRTWQLLIQRTHLVQRGESYSLVRRGPDLRVLHFREGAESAVEIDSPLLSLAARLRDGSTPIGPLGDASGTVEARRLLNELLRARWLHRRLPPGVRWNASEASFDLRHSETHPRVHEDFGSDSSGIPQRLFVQSDVSSAQLELDCATGPDLPLAVVRAALTWLLDPARGEHSLVLTAQGEFPREV